ncbi:MAG: ferrous iron transport protein A [Clostridia bacterium]|nr:ferrous iron transport protein A [Clostridia bacterium]
MCSLNDISPGEIATVLSVTASGGMRRRLQDIGIIRGTKIKCVGKSPLGDPSAYMIRGAVIALRSEDAGLVYVV